MSFDVDAWLTQAAPPTRAVKVYGRADLYAKVQQLRAYAEAAREGARAQRDAAPEVDDRRFGDPAPSFDPGDEADALELDAQADALLDELEASSRWLIVRGTRQEERKALADEFPEDAFAFTTAAIALALVEPPMSRAQVKRMLERLGEAQQAEIVQAISDATDTPVDLGKLHVA